MKRLQARAGAIFCVVTPLVALLLLWGLLLDPSTGGIFTTYGMDGLVQTVPLIALISLCFGGTLTLWIMPLKLRDALAALTALYIGVIWACLWMS